MWKQSLISQPVHFLAWSANTCSALCSFYYYPGNFSFLSSCNFFWISSYFQGFQWLDDETKERNCRILDLCHEIFLYWPNPGYKDCWFFFFWSQGFRSMSKFSLNEWNYLTTLGNERADWEAVIWMKFLQSILLVVFKPRVDTQISISPGRNTCKTALRT